MSKFKQALMISVMVFLGAFIILSMVKDQMRQERQIQHYRPAGQPAGEHRPGLHRRLQSLC